jgi:truncated hemoglobin YjbI
MGLNVQLSIIEIFASLVLEGLILGFIFQKISTNSQEKTFQFIKEQLNSVHKQNRFDYEQLKIEIHDSRNDIISQLKENQSHQKP